jgi:hypothetical protein
MNCRRFKIISPGASGTNAMRLKPSTSGHGGLGSWIGVRGMRTASIPHPADGPLLLQLQASCGTAANRRSGPRADTAV